MQIFRLSFISLLFISLIIVSSFVLSSATAQSISFRQAVAKTAATDPLLFKFYKANDFRSLWVGDTNIEHERFNALIQAFLGSAAHGLPPEKFGVDVLLAKAGAVKTDGQLGNLDVELTIDFLKYARAVEFGLLVPSSVDKEIVRKVDYQDRYKLLMSLKASNAKIFFRLLPPQSFEYARLMKEKQRLERKITAGGWGPSVTLSKLEPGATGGSVVVLRNRLKEMGYLSHTFSAVYNTSLENAVSRFQLANGLFATGVANTLTMEQINETAMERLMSVSVAMERERWLNKDLGKRHILVNLTDFKAKIIDSGKVTFQTNTVIGAHDDNRRSPEFSDVMEHMIINPSWYVPRSIVITEYLPMLKENPWAVDFLELRDDGGNLVDRADVDFKSFGEESFPYSMRQPPSSDNALGLVKFMFPNQNNIYLHDTPAKKLFDLEVRTFSHGCVRLAEPFKFAHALLAAQTSEAIPVFQAALDFKKKVQIDLESQVPVHLIYRTAITLPGGGLEFRRDIYGRDAKIWNALQLQGVVLNGFTG